MNLLSLTIIPTLFHLPGPFAGRLLVVPLAASILLMVSGCQFADVARFSYANATATHVWANEERSTTVPFTLVDNHIILPVSVNGSEPLNFVLDSGAGASVIIDSRATRALQLTLDGELPVSGVGTGPDPIAYIVPDTSMTVGELSLDGQAAIFLPLESIPFFADYEQVYFHGVIGAPFFSRFVVEIDYERRLLTFTEPDAAADRIASLMGSWREVPLQVDGGVPYVSAQVDAGQGEQLELKLLVDTGFRGALSLTPETDDQLHEPVEYFQSIDDGLSGEVFSWVAITDSLSLAGYSLENLPTSFAVSGGESDDGSSGIIGNQVLQQFNLVFDYANDRLFLAPNQQFAEPIHADRSGLQVRPHSGGGIVKRIAPGSSGQASLLQVGDIITSFDGTTVTPETIGELNRALSSGRDRIHLCWQSAAEESCEALLLASRFSRRVEE